MFEDWAVRQIILKRAQDENEAWQLYLKELEKKEVPCIYWRGQWLIGRFAGISMGQIHSDDLRTALKVSQDLTSQSDIDAFVAQASQLADRRSRGIDTSYQSQQVDQRQRQILDEDVFGKTSLEAMGDAGASMVNLVTKELKRKLEQDEKEERQLIEQARVMAEAKAATKRKAGGGGDGQDQANPVPKASSKPQAMSVLKLSTQTALAKAKENHSDAAQEMENRLIAAKKAVATEDISDEGLVSLEGQVHEALKAWKERSSNLRCTKTSCSACCRVGRVCPSMMRSARIPPVFCKQLSLLHLRRWRPGAVHRYPWEHRRHDGG